MMANRKYHQGIYTVKNPHKYLGDPKKVKYRSSWELYLFEFCDNNTKILSWASEEIIIPYISPLDKKPHRYFPDVFVEFIDVNNVKKRQLLEVKPYKETRPSKSKNPATRHTETETYVKNKAKWIAAKKWCKQHNIEFKIITEKTLFK